MSRSGIGSVDYAINPYLGCEHGCAYCYARFMLRMGHMGEEWGSFVDVKVNALERLRIEAPRRNRGVVLLSSVTDPYQPLEREYALTRGALKILLEHQYTVDILTKSNLVLRDIDLLRRFDDCEVGLTITALDDGVRSAFEPIASSVQDRILALRKLRDSGLRTYVFLGPLLPYLSDENLGSLLNEISECADRVLIDRLNIKCGNLPEIQRVMRAHFSDLQPLFESALAPESRYYENLRTQIIELCRCHGLPYNFCY